MRGEHHCEVEHRCDDASLEDVCGLDKLLRWYKSEQRPSGGVQFENRARERLRQRVPLHVDRSASSLHELTYQGLVGIHAGTATPHAISTRAKLEQQRLGIVHIDPIDTLSSGESRNVSRGNVYLGFIRSNREKSRGASRELTDDASSDTVVSFSAGNAASPTLPAESVSNDDKISILERMIQHPIKWAECTRPPASNARAFGTGGKVRALDALLFT